MGIFFYFKKLQRFIVKKNILHISLFSKINIIQQFSYGKVLLTLISRLVFKISETC